MLNSEVTLVAIGNCTGTGLPLRTSATTVSILRFASGALFLLALTSAVQSYAWSQVAPRLQGQNPNGMRIYIWGGLKTHSAGQHDYPQFLADWSKLLTERGAVVNGALHPPRVQTSKIPMSSWFTKATPAI